MFRRSGFALILSASAASAGPLSFVRSVPLVSDLAGFGGLSAIEMRGSDSAVVLSDRGQAFSLVFDRAQGRIAIEPVEQPQPDRDSEGLAYAGDALFFSYEGPAAVVDEAGVALPEHPDFADLSHNGALEALAGAPDGTLYALPERSGDRARPFPVYRYRNGTWDIWGHLPRVDGFLPAGADVGPDERLYILERAFSPLGFRSRITRLDPRDPAAPPEILLTTPPGRHDNLEGLAIWQSDSGATCLSMVSDDNFLSVQRSELVEYALTETLAGGATCD